MITTEIIVALTTLVGTFGGILVSNRLCNYRIEQLEKKIEELNDTLKKIANIEMHIAVLEERVDTLEGKK